MKICVLLGLKFRYSRREIIISISASDIISSLEVDALEHSLLSELTLLNDILDELLLALALKDVPYVIEIYTHGSQKSVTR